MEQSPASRLGIVSIDAGGNRRDHYFGELIAQSAGLEALRSWVALPEEHREGAEAELASAAAAT